MIHRHPDDIRTNPPDVVTNADRLTIANYSAPNAQGNMEYSGEAAPGTADSDPKWRITKTIYGLDGSLKVRFANSSIKFDCVWDDRENYVYG